MIQQHISGAIEAKGKTIAVLGCGPDYIYPPENKELYEKIIESGGLIVSEYPGGMKPDSEKFRMRNRIVSGLSLGVLIAEAKYRSGTAITAKYAEKQGKDIFCIPSSRENKRGIGSNNLIKKGANLVLEPNEILEKYNIDTLKKVALENEEISELTRNIKKEYKKIYENLIEPLNINEISAKTKLDITEVYSKVFMMELEGLIEKIGNKYIIKK